MVVLGLILVLAAVVAAVVVLYDNTATISIHAFGGQWNASAYWLAVIGAAVLVVAVLGIVMVRGGTRRGIRRREERKELERQNAALADQVAQTERTGRPSAGHVSGTDHHGLTAPTSAGPRDLPPTYS